MEIAMERSQRIKHAINSGIQSVRWAFNFGSWKPTESEVIKASTCIQFEEKQRIGRFVYSKDAKASLIGRLLMRKYVALASGIPYNEILFSRDDNGKPFLANDLVDQELIPFFNVSHQGNFTVIAGEVGKQRDMKLGVDVMKLEYTGGKGICDFFRIMSRQFSETEWEVIRGVGSNNVVSKEQSMLKMFCRNWCLKESFVKATGTGITVDLRKISFNIPSEVLYTNVVTRDSSVSVGGNALNEWFFEESLLGEDHCVAVAIWKKKGTSTVGNIDVNFRQIDFNELLVDSIPLGPEDAEFCENILSKEEKPI